MGIYGSVLSKSERPCRQFTISGIAGVVTITGVTVQLPLSFEPPWPSTARSGGRARAGGLSEFCDETKESGFRTRPAVRLHEEASIVAYILGGNIGLVSYQLCHFRIPNAT